VAEIRSYRSVFDLERRIYRIDRLRLNPGGIPVRGVLYCVAILAGIALTGQAPLVGGAVGAIPWYLRDLALPVGGAALLAMIRVDGRPFHLAAEALARYALGARHLAGMRPCAGPGRRWRLGEVLSLPDGSEARLRRLRYTGPGAVLVVVAHERAEWRAGALGRVLGHPQLTLRELPGRRAPARGQVIVLTHGARLRTG
jgi:hypothetical protein